MPGEWFEWEWDETLFAGSAPYYEQGRLPNAPGLTEAFRSALGLDGRGRLLDVGCGPGTVTLRLAPLFEEVVGLDADAGMIAEARRLASERAVRNARWANCRAEQLPAGLGTFRAVTFAASFHWMDRPLVAATVREMLEPNGVVVHVDNRHQDSLTRHQDSLTRHQDSLTADDELPSPPRERIARLLGEYLGADRRAGQSVRNTSPGDEAAVFRGAGFAGPEVVVVPDGRAISRTIDDIVAETFSTSSSAPHLFGERVSAFESDLRRLLTQACPDGLFSVRLPDNELKIWRPVQQGGHHDRR